MSITCHDFAVYNALHKLACFTSQNVCINTNGMLILFTALVQLSLGHERRDRSKESSTIRIHNVVALTLGDFQSLYNIVSLSRFLHYFRFLMYSEALSVSL